MFEHRDEKRELAKVGAQAYRDRWDPELARALSWYLWALIGSWWVLS